MLFRRIKSRDVGHQSYYVGDRGEALVVDPRRDIDVYLEQLESTGQRLTAIVETHAHEDFVSGAAALSSVTGAAVRRSPIIGSGFGESIEDGEALRVGRMILRAIETPGHTDGSMCFSLIDTTTSHAPVMVFSGDTMLVGATGRVDLSGRDQRAHMAGLLHDSIIDKLLRLGDGTLLMPAHGPGAAHQGRLADRDQSSVGYERLHTFMQYAATRDEFIRKKVAENLLLPKYFESVRRLNREGTAAVLTDVPTLTILRAEEVAEHLSSPETVVIDMREPDDFAEGHIPGSCNIVQEDLAARLGGVASRKTPLVLVVPKGTQDEGVMRTMMRLGHDRILGRLEGGVEAWRRTGGDVVRQRGADMDAEGASPARSSVRPILHRNRVSHVHS